ncbi:hypothetical protein GCM10022247_16160 [Allokutzneria multivorans]|uniref:Uncharacterized protein n=1 Tax=Allokutzneria multivorans TaxID=1142134 RepID=A0ABP7RFU8_9PSEU
MPERGKARARRQSDIAGADNGDTTGEHDTTPEAAREERTEERTTALASWHRARTHRQPANSAQLGVTER